MSNPAATPCIVEDREGDGRWMSMVIVANTASRAHALHWLAIHRARKKTIVILCCTIFGPFMTVLGLVLVLGLGLVIVLGLERRFMDGR